MAFFKREQPQPSEPTLEQEAMEAAKKTAKEGFEPTEQGSEAREYLNQWPEEAPHRKAIMTLAYSAIPEFVRNHPEQSMKPEDIIPNQEFNEVRNRVAKSFGVHGATVPISDKDVRAALHLAEEYLANQKPGLGIDNENAEAV